jgi:hypothetical protein
LTGEGNLGFTHPIDTDGNCLVARVWSRLRFPLLEPVLEQQWYLRLPVQLYGCQHMQLILATIELALSH